MRFRVIFSFHCLLVSTFRYNKYETSNGILVRRPRSNPVGGLRVWDRDQNSNFSEHGLVAYQIKENDACSNMVATIPSAQGVRSKLYLYENMVMSHVKSKGNIQTYILSLITTSEVKIQVL